MKKLLLIVFLIIGINAYSQNYDENGYQEVNVKAATSLTVNAVGIDTMRIQAMDGSQTFRVQRYGIDTSRIQSMTGQTYFDVRNSWDWTRYKFAIRDTVQTGQDTISRLLGYADTSDNVGELGITEWYQVIISPSDTIQVSSVSTFGTNETWVIYPNEAWTSEKFNVSYTANLFIKTLFTGGHTGSATNRIRLWGF